MLSDFNFAQYAMAHYSNPQCKTLQEFEEDLLIFTYVKKLINRDDYNPRLVLNHIVTLYNVFSVEACTKLLFVKVSQNKWSELKTYLTYLNFMPNTLEELGIMNDDIPTSEKITFELLKI